MMPCGRYQKDRKEIFDLQGQTARSLQWRDLLRQYGRTVCYKNANQKQKDVNGTEIADKVTVQLMATDPYLSPRKQLIKSSEKRDCSLLWILQTSGLKEPLQTKCNLTLNLRCSQFDCTVFRITNTHSHNLNRSGGQWPPIDLVVKPNQPVGAN